MSLSKVIEEIKLVKPFAEEDTEIGPRETLAGRRGRKNQSIERLKTLKFEYTQGLMQSAAFIIVTGEKRSELASIAKESFGCFSADPSSFYEDLAGRIPQAIYLGNSDVSNVIDVLGRHLEDKARELGISGYPQVIFRQEYRVTLKDKNDLVGLIKRVINDQVGSEIAGLQAVNSLVNEAIAKEYGGKITPIILATGDEKLALDLEDTLGRLHPRGVFLVVAGKGTKALKAVPGVIAIKEPTNETVEEALKTISGSVKGKKGE